MGPEESNNFHPPRQAGIVLGDKVACFEIFLLDGGPQMATKAPKEVIPANNSLVGDNISKKGDGKMGL